MKVQQIAAALAHFTVTYIPEDRTTLACALVAARR
jgi:hypothetical protein